MARSEQALELHRAGKLDEAEAAYLEILADEPSNADCLHLLGMVHHARGDCAKGLELVDAAVKLQPYFPAAYHNRCRVLMDLCRFDEAVKNVRLAIALQPNFPEAYNTLGSALIMMEKFTQSEPHSHKPPD